MCSNAAFHEIWSLSMQTSIIRPAQPGTRLQQLDFGIVLAIGWRAVRRQFARRRQRDALRAIADDPHLLRDLGLTREEALDEADRPFWQ
jgi:uncharacterized protein YjiS (DUF1127 family)